MNLNCETILGFYTHKNKKVFCQIKVLPSKKHKLKNTYMSLTSDQWNTFNKELEILLDGIKSEDGNKENFGKFIIRPNIEVKIRKSKISLKYFYKFLSTNGGYKKDNLGNTDELAVVLECIIDLQPEAIITLSNKPQEYEPTVDEELSTSLSYEPYTPSKTKYCVDNISTVKTPGIDLLIYNEDTYSPKPLFEATTNQLLDETVPKYKPAPIKENIKSKQDINNIAENKCEVFPQKSKEEYIPKPQKLSAFDIPAYVPTPIGSPSTQKIFNEKSNATFENKRLRGRSKTVDTMPKYLSRSRFSNQKYKVNETKCVEPLNENISCNLTRTSETRSSRDGDKSNNKCANEIINEIEDEIVPLQNYRPLKLKAKKNIFSENKVDIESKNKGQFVEEVKTCIGMENDKIISNEDLNGIYKLPEISTDSYNKNIKTRSKTLDSMPKELETENENLKVSTTLEEDKKAEISDFKFPKLKDEKIELNKLCTVANEREKRSKKVYAKVLLSTSSSEDEKREGNQTKTYSKQNDSDFENVTKLNKMKYLKETALSSSKLNVIDDDPPTRDVRKTQNPEQTYTSLRRSDRSPSNPKRFIIEIKGTESNQQKTKKLKTSPKNKELFGSDDDDDDDDHDIDNTNIDKEIKTASVFETPITKPTNCSLSSCSSSAKKKRKADRNSDCEQEKRNISQWLSKKKSSTLDSEVATSKTPKKSHRSKSPFTKSSKKSKPPKKPTDGKAICSESITSTCENFDMPSKKELEEIRNKSKIKQKENEKLKAELDKMRATPPKEVENLSLQDMPLNDILETFSAYKNELDEIYKKNCKRDYIKGHEGINHCFVIHLLQQNVQMKMLEKLTDVYTNSNNTMQPTLYANALLPEWIIRVYMEKFNFTRQEAIDQIKAQDDYRLHMEEQNDGSFMFN